MLRVYTKAEKEIRKVRNAKKLKFNISVDKVAEYDEWVVASITFHDCDGTKDKALVFTIYIYSFANGYKTVNATYAIRQNQIFLDFSISEISENIPQLDDNAADLFLTNITTSLRNGFHGQAYNKEQRNFLNLITKISWKPQISTVLKQQQQLDTGYLCYIAGVMAVSLILLILRRLKK